MDTDGRTLYSGWERHSYTEGDILCIMLHATWGQKSTGPRGHDCHYHSPLNTLVWAPEIVRPLRSNIFSPCIHTLRKTTAQSNVKTWVILRISTQVTQFQLMGIITASGEQEMRQRWDIFIYYETTLTGAACPTLKVIMFSWECTRTNPIPHKKIQTNSFNSRKYNTKALQLG